jgi:hypothetical protein
MAWSFLILSAASAAAGVALGRVISRRVRSFILIGGVEAALLGGGLSWLPSWGVELPVDAAMAQILASALLAVAAVLLPFSVGAAWSGP